MGMTMSQKILADHASLKSVEVGQLIEARLDLVLGNDITAPVAIKEFARIGADAVFDRKKIALVPDHFTPNKDIKSAEQCKMMRDFAHRMDIENYFEIGEMGIEHALIPERGLVLPGELVIGADSHTCTYGAAGAFSTGVGSTDMAAAMASGTAWFKVPAAIRVVLEGSMQGWTSGKDLILHLIGLIGVDGALYRSLEFTGPGLASISMDERFTIANMAIEAGAKNGIFPVDEKTRAWAASVASRSYKVVEPDADAVYERVITIDLSALTPTVAFPHLPSNTKPIGRAEKLAIDQVVIGSCTNGRIEDLRVAASILRGKKVAKGLRCIVFPATQSIYLAALREGLVEDMVRAGAVVSTPTCGPCLGGHMGILAGGERAIATTNRNFVGRMGHPESEVYLASPAVAAASAVAGHLVDPAEIMAAPEHGAFTEKAKATTGREKA
jgi:3-isopropylmalate/(R)-2-methylmalate dehydratase large subunit